jgi:hypothetical protein
VPLRAKQKRQSTPATIAAWSAASGSLDAGTSIDFAQRLQEKLE